MPATDIRPHLPLTAVAFEILLALADGERHGYGIMQEVDDRTGGAVRIRPGSLYRAIGRLLEAGLLEETDERPDPALDDERRRYYRLTDLGRRVAVAESERLSRAVRTARSKKLLPARHA